ncbi:MAG: site-specific integrase [Eubacteriales bacterium]|nr:site-specific integrase [Eubacteriales bacterium]
MAKARKDERGRALRKGEVQRASDKRYMYTYTDPMGRRKFIYAQDLTALREKEKQLLKDQLDGLDVYVAGKATVNATFDRYMSTKYDLRDTTRSNYIYIYDRFIRDTFGRKKIAEVKYSDVLQFYYHLLNVDGLALGTLDSVHTLLHPTFQLAVRDEIIRKNPSDGVMKEVSKKGGKDRGVRHALTVEQQRAFMDYIANHPVYYHWWPLFAVLLGTGGRIGEVVGLRWEDVDFERRLISINHSIVYYPVGESRKSTLRVSKPKTEAGIRTIPMLDVVYEALQMERDEQEENGFNETEIDGMKGFIFINRFGTVPNPQAVNRAIKRISSSYNAEEVINAKKERRKPVILPEFSCHHLRHTFCTRLCEHETNLKVIQAIMGHRNIETTMDIYAEATDRKKQESFDNLSKLDIF